MSELRRSYTVEWVPLSAMRVRVGVTQRPPDQARIDSLALDFNVDGMGMPEVNRVGDEYWIMDGQTRIEALKKYLGKWDDQKIECFVYHGLTLKQEAEHFLRGNNVKGVSAFDKYQIALTAERENETNINAVVRLRKLAVSRQNGEDSISCVGTLLRVYRRGLDVLSRTLEIAHASFGRDGLESDLLDGISRVLERYGDLIKPSQAIGALRAVTGGANAIRSRAAKLRLVTGADRAQCIAAAIFEPINRKREGKKLPPWWKSAD